MFRNKSASTHSFAMVPRADIPRSSFRIQTTHKTTFGANKLIPLYLDEILPGDSFNVNMTAFVRMATPLFPIMDNLYLDTFFFFVPNRLVWNNWQKFMGEQEDPGDSTDYVIPQTQAFQATQGTLPDYFGIPNSNQTDDIQVNALPFRAYNLIWNEWFRDENLQDSLTVPKDDGPDPMNIYALRPRGKRKDYFTGALPWPQKGEAVTINIGDAAPVNLISHTINNNPNLIRIATTGAAIGVGNDLGSGTGGRLDTLPNSAALVLDPNGRLEADLTATTGVTINALRQAFQIQKLLERDARGGTRYTEIVRSHFGVISPDARLQRPEYIGGGSTPIGISPIAQTGPTGTTGSDSPLGTLGAMGQAVSRNNNFSYSATEHGYIIGLASIRADLNYQQGLRKMWSRSTRYDFYFPAFAMLGEQAILRKEIYLTGNNTDDNLVFGYQERWAEYRYHPGKITGLFNSKATGTLDAWHLAQNFTTPPVLDESFIEDNPPMQRILAVTEDANAQFLCDAFFNIRAARPLPMFSVPGLIDHF